jgi:hypothetical protein
MNTHDEMSQAARTEGAGALSNGSEPLCCKWKFLHALQSSQSYRVEVLPFRHLSPSIAPKRNYLAVDLTVSSLYAWKNTSNVRYL